MTKNLHAHTIRSLAIGALAVLLLALAALMLPSCACSKEEPAPEVSSAPKAVVVDDAKPVSSEPAPAYSNDPFWVLIMGLDTREGTVEDYDGSMPYSDTIMLARIDPVTHRIGIVSIPRDTSAIIDGELHKINDGYHYHQVDGAVQAVEALTGVDVGYYMTCTFVQFVQFVDAIGGVNAYLPEYITLEDIVYGNDVELDAGEHHLNGPEALVAARVRKSYEWEGEAHRQQISRQLVCNAISQVAADPATAAANANILLGNCVTNMPVDRMLGLVADFSDHAGEISFVTGTGPFVGGIDPRNEKYMIPDDPAIYAQIVQRIENHEEWQDLVANPF